MVHLMFIGVLVKFTNITFLTRLMNDMMIYSLYNSYLIVGRKGGANQNSHTALYRAEDYNHVYEQNV